MKVGREGGRDREKKKREMVGRAEETERRRKER
jgi:hypothetical protein